MPVQKGKSSILAKLGNRFDGAVKSHAADDTDYGFIRVPPGITNGIARLSECYFAEYKSGPNQGKPYFRAVGVIIEPTSIIRDGQEIQVKGLQTSIMEPICDTKTQKGKITTVDEHVAEVENEMRKLAGEDFTSGVEKLTDLEDLARDLVESGPYFRFSTSQSAATKEFPDPRIWENWSGSKGLEGYSPPDDEAEEMEDNSAAASRNGLPTIRSETTARKTKVAPSTRKGRSEEEEETEAEEPFSGDREEDDQGDGSSPDLDTLTNRADAGDEEASMTLEKLANEAGVGAGLIKAAKKWRDVAALIKDASPAASEETEEEEGSDSKEPDEDKCYMFYPLDPKTKKRAKKAIECEVLKGSIKLKDRTLKLRSLDDRTTFVGVSWDDIEEAT